MEKLFEYHHIQVRTTVVNEEVWFVAKDVCDVLEIPWRGNDTLSTIRDEWKGVRKFRTPGGNQPLTIVSEAAVYKLAFRSNKPEAERFMDWIAGEVIPQIRQTGQYVPVKSGTLPLESHTKRTVQIEMSKRVNGRNYARGGKLACIKYSVKNCLAHTGKTPTAIKKDGKLKKLPATVCKSAKEVLRRMKPEKACCMSLADNLVEQGHPEDKVFAVSVKAEIVFRGMLELGATPAELKA